MNKAWVSINSALAAMYLLVYLYCKLNNYTDPTSGFFDPQRAYRLGYSATRIEEARQFLEKNAEDQPPRTETPRLCVSIPSYGHRSFLENVLTQTLASLLDHLTPEQRSTIHLVVFITDQNATAHPSWTTLQTSYLADEILVYKQQSGQGVAQDQRGRTKIRKLPMSTALVGPEKVAADFASVMEACGRSGAPYVALIEDDVLAARDWLLRLFAGLESLEAESHDRRDWSYVRLFFSETLLGWNAEEWPTYAAWITFVYALVTGLFLCCSRLTPHRLPASMHQSLIAALAIWLPLSIALYFFAGRLSVRPMQPGLHEMPAYGCCSQGLVFPQRNLEGVIKSLRSPKYSGLYPDQIIEGWSDRSRLAKLALVPSVLQHIGRMGSSTAVGSKKTTWNFAFEAQAS